MRQGQKILFVCTGNTCRSYMAETIAKDYLLKKYPGVALEITSAGTGCLAEEPASLQAKEVMSELGLANTSHRAKRLTAALVKEADLILAMTLRQRSDILKMAPEAEHKVFLLKQYTVDQEERQKRTEDMALLREEIKRAEKEFMAQHGGAISMLEMSRKRILQELAEVEEQLDDWERRLAQAALDKKQELAKLEAKDQDLEIVDPYGQPVECYRACAREIEPLVSRAMDKYLEL